MKTPKKRAPVLSALAMLAVFETVAVVLWRTQDNVFYLFNFTYIGCAVALGLFLLGKGVPWARRAVQLLVGLYMLVGLGLIGGENMQIEGFWFYLFSGVFQAAVIHYAVAKIVGPLLFGRGWCGYACWTAMVLDLLPYRRPQGPRRGKGPLRYVLFVLSAALVAGPVPPGGGGQGAGDGLALSGGERHVLYIRHPAGCSLEGQPGLLQIPLSHHRLSQAHELLVPVPGHGGRRGLCGLRGLSRRLPHGGGHDRQRPEPGKRDGVHPMYGVRQGLPP